MKTETVQKRYSKGDFNRNQKTIIKRADGSVRVQTVNDEPSLAQQQFKDECDINILMKKYGNDPVAFQALTRPGGIYADFSDLEDYQGMLQQVQNAQEAFMALPATLRARFSNDPGNLIAFLENPQNYDEGVSLGLLVPNSKTQNQNSKPNETQNDQKHSNHKQKSGKPSPATPEAED